jgi:hypothetical protein
VTTGAVLLSALAVFGHVSAIVALKAVIGTQYFPTIQPNILQLRVACGSALLMLLLTIMSYIAFASGATLSHPFVPSFAIVCLLVVLSVAPHLAAS